MKIRPLFTFDRQSQLGLTVAAMILAVLFTALAGWRPVLGETTAATYYVAPSGNDANPGTINAPWRTIDKANLTLRAGDTVILRAGVYNEVIYPKQSGLPGQKITYTRLPGERVVIQGKPGLGQLVVLFRSHIVVDGLELSYGHGLVKANLRWSWVLLGGQNANYNEIRNCRLVRQGDPLTLYRQGYWDRGFDIGGGRYNVIENNYIRGLNQGIHVRNGAQYNRIRNNTISETSQSSIVLETSLGVVQGNLIEHNILEGSAIEDGIQFHQNLKLSTKSTDVSNFGVIVRDNIFRNHAENAIDLKGAAYVVIESNTFYGTIGSNNGPLNGWNRNALNTITCGAGSISRDVIIRHNIFYDNSNGIKLHPGYKVYHNTIAYNNRDYTGSNSSFAPKAPTDFVGIIQADATYGRIGIKNNLIGGHKNGGQVVLRMMSSSSLAIDYNLYFNSGAINLGASTGAKSWQRFTLESWRAFLRNYSNVQGRDENSLATSDPRFVRVATPLASVHTQHDFALANGSPAIDQGGPLTWAKGNGSGVTLPVQDAGYFFYGYGITTGDLIKVGNNPPVRITAINYGTNQLTLATPITWRDGDGVSWPYNGAAPDIGASESGVQTAAAGLDRTTFLPLVSGPLTEQIPPSTTASVIIGVDGTPVTDEPQAESPGEEPTDESTELPPDPSDIDPDEEEPEAVDESEVEVLDAATEG
jgi:parallel beta-helix repeat protein